MAKRIDGALRRIEGRDMVGALDMGGSSTQLIFYVGSSTSTSTSTGSDGSTSTSTSTLISSESESESASDTDSANSVDSADSVDSVDSAVSVDSVDSADSTKASALSAPVSSDDFWSNSWLNFGVEKVRERFEQSLIVSHIQTQTLRQADTHTNTHRHTH